MWCRDCGAAQINALGFCVGGTMLATPRWLCWLHGAKNRWPVPPCSTTLLDFSDTGILDVFIDEAFVKNREAQMGQGGLLKGQSRLPTFSFLAAQ